MSDSIYVRNNALNDSDSLTSSAGMRVVGVLPAPTVLTHVDRISTTVVHHKIDSIFLDNVASCKVIEETSRTLTANYISTQVAFNKDTVRTYVIGETRKDIREMEPISIDVAYNTNRRFNLGNSKDYLSVKKALDHEKKMINMPMSMAIVKFPETHQINAHLVSTKVMIENKALEEGFIQIPFISIDVNNDYPNAEGPIGGASGGDLEKMVFTIQQMSFFEFRFYFKLNKVVDVMNLPQGMQFDKEKQRMFGTPLLSGRYPINILLEDNSNVQGIIEVPKLYREL